MDAGTLKQLVARYQQGRDFIQNEEQTKQSLVIPFVRALGYDPSNPREVRLEYTAQFTTHDGKRYPDRMDFAIFDETGQHPFFVIETKPLGADVRVRSPQLARYMGQLHELRFGLMTDGCHYLFYGDLQRPNIMDDTPFFQFSLSDEKLDIPTVATFLDKFSRGQFTSDRLVLDAEDSHYRQGMTRKLAAALQDPSSDETFLRWLSENVYGGKRTQGVMERLGRIAKTVVRPAVLRVIGDDFLNDLRDQIMEASEQPREAVEDAPLGQKAARPDEAANPTDQTDKETRRLRETITTDEELAFLAAVKGVCRESGVPDDQVLSKDTVNYFNVSARTPTRWFVRYFGDTRKKAVTTLVPTDEARELAAGFDVEDAPAAFGVSRVFIEGPEAVPRLRALLLRSLELCLDR